MRSLMVFVIASMLVLSVVLFGCSDSKDADGQISQNTLSKSSSTLTSPELRQLEEKYVTGFSLENKREIQPRGWLPNFSKSYAEVFPCDANLQAEFWEELSLEERMLANGYEIIAEDGSSSASHGNEVMPLHLVGGLMEQFYTSKGRSPESREELLEWRIGNLRSPPPPGYEPFDVDKAIEDLFKKLTSPVTGKLLEWDHPEFSAGNAYVTIINDHPEAFALAEKKWLDLVQRTPRIQESERKYPSGKRIHKYYRAYGKTGVLNDSFSTAIRPDPEVIEDVFPEKYDTADGEGRELNKG